MSNKVWYRLNINYLSVDYEDRALETSSPIKSLKEGFAEYTKAIMLEKCVDVPDLPARVDLTKYTWNATTNKTKKDVILNNELEIKVLLYKMAV